MFLLRITLLAALAVLSGCSASQQDSLLLKVTEMGRHQAGLIPHQVALDDVTMSYLERPGSGPVVMLVHGFSANKDTWLRFAAELPADYRIIAPDLAGHGDTPAPSGGDFNLIRQADRLHALAAHLKIEKFHILGSSMGGAISAIYATRYPQQIASLTLMNAAGVDAPNPSEYMQALAEGRNPLIATDEASFEYRWDFLMSRPPALPWPLRPALIRDTLKRQSMNEAIFAGMLATREQLATSGFEQQLMSTVTMPVLIIWGAEDRVLDVSAVEAFKQRLPQAETEIYAGIGHLPMFENPQESAGRYQRFISAQL